MSVIKISPKCLFLFVGTDRNMVTHGAGKSFAHEFSELKECAPNPQMISSLVFECVIEYFTK